MIELAEDLCVLIGRSQSYVAWLVTDGTVECVVSTVLVRINKLRELNMKLTLVSPRRAVSSSSSSSLARFLVLTLFMTAANTKFLWIVERNG